MKKLKVLPMSLREKKRYVGFKVIHEKGEDFAHEDLIAAVWNTLLDFYGEYGVSNLSFQIVKNVWYEKKKMGVIRCKHTEVPKVIAGLGLISRLGDTKVTIKILKVSGTLKKVKEKLAIEAKRKDY
ncbi:MAG: ribonuclease P protein component 2 [Candidatus Aenigmarchaeota archaeon]|nr:ribonuclease P protein component 2 [Candidatus Aenigmarchaeota archaeon]